MDISTLIGLVGGIFVILLTLIIEGGHVSAFLQLSAFVLIFAGSIAVAITSFGLKEVVKIPEFLRGTIFPPSVDLAQTLHMLVSMSERARRDGLLVLEEEVQNLKDELMRLGIELAVDGVDPEAIRNILEDLSDSMAEHEKIPAEVFETLGGFSPTLGIIGTVMGLVHVLESLGSGGAEELGRGIAVAFIATFYGIGFANLIWLPLSNKVKNINHKLKTQRSMIVNGVLAIQSGDNPRVAQEKILSNIGDMAVRRKIMEKSEK
ncbi:MAG: MotA/TolQ/ExbB proton channel family protein [Spirochaetia bacterium]|nr:MotA/TolQ/ExbB proton channel family protein [Spirochaetia bacterium]